MNRCIHCFGLNEDVFNVCAFCGSSVGCPADQKGNPLAGQLLNKRYFIGTIAGRGGFGILYMAYDTLLSRTVAVKEFFPGKLACRGADGISVLPLDYRKAEEFEYRKFRFQNEATLVADFAGCSFFPRIFDFFEENGSSYIVMEYLHGQCLSEFLGKDTISEEFVTYAVSNTALGVSYLHRADIVHRDISPDNIFVCSENEKLQIKLLDFGGAIKIGENGLKNDIIIKGGYSAPEQRTSGCVGKSADVYSLGVTLFALLTGMQPTQTGDKQIIFEKECKKANINPKLGTLINRATDFNPNKRFKDAGDFYKALSTAV